MAKLGSRGIKLFLKIFKQRMLDIASQNLNFDIHDIDKLRTYNLLKNDFDSEQYLSYVKNKMFRSMLWKFWRRSIKSLL